MWSFGFSNLVTRCNFNAEFNGQICWVVCAVENVMGKRSHPFSVLPLEPQTIECDLQQEPGEQREIVNESNCFFVCNWTINTVLRTELMGIAVKFRKMLAIAFQADVFDLGFPGNETIRFGVEAKLCARVRSVEEVWHDVLSSQFSFVGTVCARRAHGILANH